MSNIIQNSQHAVTYSCRLQPGYENLDGNRRCIVILCPWLLHGEVQAEDDDDDDDDNFHDAHEFE